jgi:uncharacterized RDD family membrane protein YckC
MSFARPKHDDVRDDALTEGVLTRRVIAWFIDIVLIGLIAWIAWGLILILGVLTLGIGFALLGFLPAIGLLYHTLFVAGAHAATPGMRIMDLTVRHEADLGLPSLLQAIVFTAGLWLTLAFVFPLLLVALVTVRKRELHDMAAGVVVVRNRALTRSRASLNMGPGTP